MVYQNYNSEKQISIFNATADTIAKLNKLFDDVIEESRKGEILKWYHTLENIYRILESTMDKVEEKKREKYNNELEETDKEIKKILREAYIARKQGKTAKGTMYRIKTQLEKKELTLRRIREDVGLGLSFKGTDDDEMD